jgi:hypothetical protein
MNFLKPGILLSGWITLTVSTQGFAQNHTRTSFTKEELLSTAFMWLADKDSLDELHIYKLSCPSCILELKGAFDQDPKNLGAINFSTLKKEDRPLAQALLATTLSYTDEGKRGETFGELLNLFVHSADQFQRNPKEWLSLCLSFWNTEEVDVGDRKTWADSLNWLDRQNRVNVLMDLSSFPGSLELRENNLIPPIKQQTYRDQYLFVTLSVPWLKYPEVHPNPNQAQAANHPQNLKTVMLGPLDQFTTTEWKKYAEDARAGAFLNFIGDSDVLLHERMLEFLAGILDLPTDVDRREAMAKAFEAIGESRLSSKTSLLVALPRVKNNLPIAGDEQKQERMAEAKRMMEDFLVYDLIRRKK